MLPPLSTVEQSDENRGHLDVWFIVELLLKVSRIVSDVNQPWEC